MSRDGYYVAWDALRRQSSVVRDHRDQVAEAGQTLWQALDRDRATLGHDVYGAEVARRLPGIEERIFAAFDAYLTELDGTSDHLSKAATNYESADRSVWEKHGHANDPTI